MQYTPEYLLKFLEDNSIELFFFIWGNYPEFMDSLRSSEFFSFPFYLQKSWVGYIWLL